MNSLPYLSGYPPELLERARALLQAGQVEELLAKRYPERHQIHSSKALYAYVQELKARYMKSAAPLAKVLFDDRVHSVHNALGLHVTSTRAHGSKLRKRRELRVSSLFKDSAPEFLRMIVVHELAHMKHAQHDRDFYRLCTHMEPDYHQFEFDLRLQLTLADWQGE